MAERKSKVMQLANEEARRLCNNTVGAEHLLLALSRLTGSKAARALAARGITYQALLGTIKSKADGSDPTPGGVMRVGMDAKEAIENAVGEARALGNSAVDPEHILLGICMSHANQWLIHCNCLGQVP